MPTRTQDHACAERRCTQNGLYAGVHDDTAAGGITNTYAWVQAGLRTGTPTNGYARPQTDKFTGVQAWTNDGGAGGTPTTPKFRMNTFPLAYTPPDAS